MKRGDNYMIRLPLNANPKIRTYTNDLYLNAVASANCGNNNLLASLNIKDFNLTNFNILKTDNASLNFVDNNVEIYSDKSNKPVKIFIYKKFCLNEEFVVMIKSQNYNSPWSSVNAFAANQVNLKGNNKFNCRIGVFSNGILKCESYEKFNTTIDRKYNINAPYYFKIVIKSNCIEGFISLNQKDWDILCKSEIENCHNQEVGIDLEFYSNLYWEWLYSSYVNIFFNENWELHLNYLTAPSRNYNCNSVNPLVYFKRENPYLILEQNGTFTEYIKLNIEHGQYVELYFDEFFIPHSANYHTKHFLHAILAYGFDETAIYFLGVQNGKPIEFKLLNEYVEEGCHSSVKINDTNTFIIYEFLPENYSLSVTALYKAIRDYLSKVPDNIEYYNIDDPNNVYGINVFDELSTGTGLELFMSDIRIPFLIDEHTRLMKERVIYLINSNILTNEECKEVSDMLNYLCDCTNNLLLITLKYSMTGSKNIPLKVAGKLKDIQSQQKKCYSKLLCLLKKHVNKDRIEFFGEFN